MKCDCGAEIAKTPHAEWCSTNREDDKAVEVGLTFFIDAGSGFQPIVAPITIVPYGDKYLDDVANIYGISRKPSATDDALRKRLRTILLGPRP